MNAKRKERLTYEETLGMMNRLPHLLPEDLGSITSLRELARELKMTSPKLLEFVLRSYEILLISSIEKTAIDNPAIAEKMAECVKVPQVLAFNGRGTKAVRLVPAEILMKERAIAKAQEVVTKFKKHHKDLIKKTV